MYKRPFFAIVCVAGLMAMLGCGKKAPILNVVKTTGTVTYNGNPVEGAQVTFFPRRREGGKSAPGRTDSAGTFRLQSYVGGSTFGDGAQADDYKVVIFKADAAAAGANDPTTPPDLETMSEENRALMEERMRPLGKLTEAEAKQRFAGGKVEDRKISLLPGKYADATTTDLEASVTAGEKNEFVFDLND